MSVLMSLSLRLHTGTSDLSALDDRDSSRAVGDSEHASAASTIPMLTTLLSESFCGLPGGPIGHDTGARTEGTVTRLQEGDSTCHVGSWYTFPPAGLSQESITGNRDDTAPDVQGRL